MMVQKVGQKSKKFVHRSEKFEKDLSRKVLILTRYFVRDFETYGDALIQSARQIIGNGFKKIS